MLEPIFDKPLKEISLGKVLVSLFRASRRFNVEIQPQLVLLQKTLLNVEGLGRELDPDLDLWVTAKPFLERWMMRSDRLARAGTPLPRGGAIPGDRAAAAAAADLPEALGAAAASDAALIALAAAQRARNRWLAVISILLAALIAILLARPL